VLLLVIGYALLGANCINMHSDLLFSVALCGKDKVRRKTMKYKMTGAAGLAGAFIAGMVVATALGGGIDAVGAKTLGAAAQGQEVTLQRVFSPTVTDEDIALLRKDVRAMKMQVIVEPRRI
jgi:hypothetical protein